MRRQVKYRRKTISDNLNTLNVIDFAKTTGKVSLSIERNGNFTIASANLVVNSPESRGEHQMFVSTGVASRNPADKESNPIGENIAIARALRRLSQRLMNETMTHVHQRCTSQNGQAKTEKKEQKSELVARTDN